MKKYYNIKNYQIYMVYSISNSRRLEFDKVLKKKAKAVFQLRKIWGGKVILDIKDAWPETFYRFIPGGEKIRKSLGPIVFAPWFQQARRAYAQTNAISGVAKKYIDLALGGKSNTKLSGSHRDIIKFNR